MKKYIILLIIIIIVDIALYITKSSSQAPLKTTTTSTEKYDIQDFDFNKFPKNSIDNVSQTIEKQSNKKSNYSSQKHKTIMGNPIPNWVYEITSSSDRYSNLILSNSNVIFFSYADCPIGQGRKAMVKRAIARADVYDNFSNKSELVPTGSTYRATCAKSYKNGMCYFNPKERNEGTCKCAPHYFLNKNAWL